MARLVLDTNSLIQCISRRSRYHELWLSFLDGRNTLCVTTEILQEYVVTDDSHYDVLREVDFPVVDVINLDEILKRIIVE